MRPHAENYEQWYVLLPCDGERQTNQLERLLWDLAQPMVVLLALE